MKSFTESEFKHQGLDCEIILTEMGHRCGYVRVPKDNKLFKCHYDMGAVCNMDVHGGVTFSGTMNEAKDDWWLGFDCAHGGDAPDLNAAKKAGVLDKYAGGLLYSKHGIIRSKEYTENECRLLTDQVAKYGKV